jgi:hypothetical protein
MSSNRNIIFIFITLIFVISIFSPAYSQLTRKRLAVREKFTKVEIYFDGGYYNTGMSTANDALGNGLDYLTQILAPNDTITTNWGENKELGGSNSFGGGLNYNLSQNFGFGFKFLFSQHEGDSKYLIIMDDIELNLPDIGTVLLDIEDAFVTKVKYSSAPILMNAYYRLKPIPSFRSLNLVIGAGGGFYTNTIKFEHSMRQDYINPPSVLNIPPQFFRFYNKCVAKPLGGFIFATVNLRGSNAISTSFNLEYHLVPEIDLKPGDWSVGNDFQYYFINTLDPVELEAAATDLFAQYIPEKLDFSGLRVSGTITFSF